MKRSISIALLSLLIVFPVFAQDTPDAPTPTVEAVASVTPDATEVVIVPPVATVEPPVIVVNNPPDSGTESNSMLLHFLLEGVLTAAVVFMAVKQGKLIPPETVDKVLVRFFEMVKSVTVKTETPIDDTIASISEEMLRKMVQQELAKQQASSIQPNSTERFQVGR